MDMTIKRSWFFADLKPGMIVWLGAAADDRRAQCDIDQRHRDGSLGFLVLNGAWRGRLYEQVVEYENGEVSNVLYIIDARGVRHEPVYIVDVEERSIPPRRLPDDEVPF